MDCLRAEKIVERSALMPFKDLQAQKSTSCVVNCREFVFLRLFPRLADRSNRVLTSHQSLLRIMPIEYERYRHLKIHSRS